MPNRRNNAALSLNLLLLVAVLVLSGMAMAMYLLNRTRESSGRGDSIVNPQAGHALADSGEPTASESDFSAPQQYSYAQLHMAMPVRLTVWANSESQAKAACKAAFRRITALELILSDYDRGSELNQLCQKSGQGRQPVGDALFTVLQHAQQLYQASDGAFDPTAGPVIRLWRQARRTGEFPSQEVLAAALEKVGWDKLSLDAQQRSVELDQEGMLLDLGGIAKGYIGDQVIAELARHGITSAQYRAGGDMVLGAAPPGQAGWNIDLPGVPNQQLANCGVSVSGDTEQFVEIDGRRYSHVVDPRAGLGVTSGWMVVVIAPSGIESDSLASTGCVLGPERFRRLIRTIPGIQAWVLDPPNVPSTAQQP